MDLVSRFPLLAQRIRKWILEPGFNVSLKDGFVGKFFLAYLHDVDVNEVGIKLRKALDDFNRKSQTPKRLRWRRRVPQKSSAKDGASDVDMSTSDLTSPQPSFLSPETSLTCHPSVSTETRELTQTNDGSSLLNKKQLSKSELKLKSKKCWEDRYQIIGRSNRPDRRSFLQNRHHHKSRQSSSSKMSMHSSGKPHTNKSKHKYERVETAIKRKHERVPEIKYGSSTQSSPVNIEINLFSVDPKAGGHLVPKLLIPFTGN